MHQSSQGIYKKNILFKSLNAEVLKSTLGILTILFFLVIGSRFLEKKEIEEIITAFLESEFEGGRHERRIKKIPKQ